MSVSNEDLYAAMVVVLGKLITAQKRAKGVTSTSNFHTEAEQLIRQTKAQLGYS